MATLNSEPTVAEICKKSYACQLRTIFGIVNSICDACFFNALWQQY